jgi:hypothetical protein
VAKRNRLREAQLWLDDPSYYSSPRLLQVRMSRFLMLPDVLQACLAQRQGLKLCQVPQTLSCCGCISSMHAWMQGGIELPRDLECVEGV